MVADNWIKLTGKIGFCGLIMILGCIIFIYKDEFIGIVLISIGIGLGYSIIEPEIELRRMKVISIKRAYGL